LCLLPNKQIFDPRIALLLYNGPGGVNYNNDATNNAADGKLYTVAEAKAISLPAGWRLPAGNDFASLLNVIGEHSPRVGEVFVNDALGLRTAGAIWPV
jgi:uncharacterized protein (TIGR02145 family)